MSKKNGALSREDLMARLRSKVWPVDVEEWGGTVYVRKIPGPLMVEISRSQVLADGEDDEAADFRFWDEYHEKVFLKGMANADGTPFFESMEQVQEFLDASDLEPITAVLNEIIAVSGGRGETLEALAGN